MHPVHGLVFQKAALEAVMLPFRAAGVSFPPQDGCPRLYPIATLLDEQVGNSLLSDSLRKGIRMDRHPVNPQWLILGLPLLRLHHPSLLINLHIRLLQLRQHIPALILRRQIQHLPKHRARPVQMRRARKCDKKLTPVDRRARCALRPGRRAVLDGSRRHGEDPTRVVSERGEVDFLVQCAGVVDGCAAFRDVVEWKHWFRGCGGAASCGPEGDVAALDHEAGHETVERCDVVCAAGAEGEEVLGGYVSGFIGFGDRYRVR